MKAPKDIIKVKSELSRAYNVAVAGYTGSRSRPSRLLGAVFRPSLRPRVVVDVGCGPGTNAIKLAMMGVEVVCLDLSSAMLRSVRRRSIRRGVYALVSPVQADMEYLPLRSSSVGSMIYVASIHHLPPRRALKALREARRCLVNGGSVLVTVWSLLQARFIPRMPLMLLSWVRGRTWWPTETFVPWRSRHGTYMRFYHLYLPGELERRARRAGLRVVERGAFRGASKLLPDNYYIVAVKGEGGS